MKVVIDTNVLLVSVSDRSKHHWLYRDLLLHKFQLFITNSILNEYEEKIGYHWKPAVAQTVIRTLLELPNVHPTTVFFQMGLMINDPDDDKFVDCAFAAGAII
jgi:predicted nucleic acid-binding protein